MQAVARHSATQSGIEADWQTETLITVGATEALTSAFMGLLNEGDEVLPRCLRYQASDCIVTAQRSVVHIR